MAAEPSRLNEEIEKLRTLRDELRVKLDLGGKDARDLFEAAEKHWSKLEGRLRLVKRETGREARNVGAAAEKLAEELRDAYRRIRDLLKAS